MIKNSEVINRSLKDSITGVALVLEQGLLSAPSFLYLPIVVRLTSLENMYSISLGLSLYFIFISVYDAFIIEPLFTTTHSSKDVLEDHCSLTFLVAIVLSVIFAITFLAMSTLHQIWIEAVRIGLLLILSLGLMQMSRRILHLYNETNVSFVLASAYSATFFFLSNVLYFHDYLHGVYLSFPYVISSLMYVLLALPCLPKPRFCNVPKVVFDQHIEIGLANSIFAVLANMTLNIYPIIFSLLGRPDYVSLYRLAAAIAAPFPQVAASLYSVILSRITRKQVISTPIKIIVFFNCISPIAVALLLEISHYDILSLLMGSIGNDLKAASQIALIGVSVSIISNTVGIVIRSKVMLGTIKLSGFTQFLATGLLCWPISKYFGVEGAYAVYTIANLFGLFVNVFSLINAKDRKYN